MSLPRKFALITALLALALLAAGCGAAPPANDQATIDAAVHATLTAVAAPAATPSTPVPAGAAQNPPQSQAAQQVVLPAQVTGFNPAARPQASKGDPQAPVVMYEWSDYT